MAELAAGSQFPGEAGDVGVAQTQGGRRCERRRPAERGRGEVTAEGGGARVSATLGSSQRWGRGRERAEGGVTNKGGESFPETVRALDELGGGAWVSLPDEVRVPGVSTGRRAGWECWEGHRR